MLPLKRIPEFQQMMRINDEQLAKAAGTTVATLKKWISGKAAPTAAQLRDVAIVLSSTKIELLGLDAEYLAVSRFKPPLMDRALFAGGHLGLRLPGEEYSRWYPVSASVACYVRSVLQSNEIEYPWICVPTRSSRLLFINTSECDAITLLDEVALGVDGDWEHTLVQEELNSEFAAAIVEYLDGWTEDSSETLLQHLESITEGSDKYLQLGQTHVHYVSGKHKLVSTESESLHQNFGIIYDETGAPFNFELSNSFCGYDLYIPAHKVCLVDAPLFMYEKLSDSTYLNDSDL